MLHLKEHGIVRKRVTTGDDVLSIEIPSTPGSCPAAKCWILAAFQAVVQGVEPVRDEPQILLHDIEGC